MGIEGINPRNRSRSSRNKSTRKLLAASYNTFSSVGTSVALPPEALGNESSQSRDFGTSRSFTRDGLKTRVLADDKNGRVIYMFRDKIVLIPLADFEVPNEPFMLLDVGSTHLAVGKKQRIEMAVRDPRIKIDFSNLPEGAKQIEGGIEWTPQDEHVGREVIVATLTFNDIRRVVDVELQVSQPNFRVPFEIGGMLIDDSASRAVCWTTKAGSHRNASPYSPPPEGTLPSLAAHQIAIVPLAGSTGKPIHRTLDYPIRKAFVSGAFIVVMPANDSMRLDLYDVESMKLVKTLASSAPLKHVTSKNNRLLFHGASSVDVFDLATLKKVKTIGTVESNRSFRSSRTNSSALRLKDGLMVGGMMYDKTGDKPKLMVGPNGYTVVGSSHSGLFSGSFLRQYRAPLTYRPSGNTGPRIVAGPMSIPRYGIHVSLESWSEYIRLSGSNYTSHMNRQISLVLYDATGTRQARIPITNKIRLQASSSGQATTPLMQVVGQDVFIANGDRLFRWSAEKLRKVEDPKTNKADPAEFYVVPQQTTFVTNAKKTELRHTIKGGSGPFQYYGMSLLEGITIDGKTGVVSIDRSIVAKQAEARVATNFSRRVDEARAIQNLRAATIALMEPTTRLIGRKLKGIPVAIPIHFKVMDTQARVAEMQYFVLTEVSYPAVVSQLKVKVKKQEAVRLAIQQQRESRFSRGRRRRVTPSDNGALEKRVVSLEVKIDLLVRQMAMLAQEKEKD